MSNISKTEAIPYQEEGIKDTIESVVVALILAFVFRAFIVEAFVIPTGSMAPTLYGAHGTIACEDCGTEFAYGLRDLEDHRRTNPILSSARAICPNCNHRNTDLAVSDDKLNAEKGDRILVLKWPLDFGGKWMDPNRWDVTVFKDPSDGVTNFIKRLVGLPNELLMILDGDVYTVGLDELDSDILNALEKQRHKKYLFRTKQSTGRLVKLPPLSEKILRKLDNKFVLPRKTASAQKVLWTVVYNHDHPPIKLDPNQPRWSHGRDDSGWDAPNRRVVFQSRGLIHDYIELTGKDFRATNAYNIRQSTMSPKVMDHRIRFVLTPQDSDAILRLRLAKLGRVFWATFQMDGNVSLIESKNPPLPGDLAMAQIQIDPFEIGKAVEIAFENVDYRLAIDVKGEEILTSSSEPDSPNYYAPDIRMLRMHQLPLRRNRKKIFRDVEPPRIYGENGNMELSHLVVERDVYYFHHARSEGIGFALWAPRRGWGSVHSPIMLRENEFFMLGDNTSASRDSRIWDRVGVHLDQREDAIQLGTVPRDQLIGKAFFVYWPSGHRMPWLPRIGNWTWSIIPDVGRMRTIE